jgi:hypothetical protein
MLSIECELDRVDEITQNTMANTTNSNVTTLRVIVPSDAGPGRQLIVTTPDGRRISAIVPNGHEAGSHFLVRCPPHPPPALSLREQHEQYYQNYQNSMMKETSSSPTQSPQSQPQSPSRSPSPSQSPSVHKIKVPIGKRKGEKFNVTLPDGSTIVATVPQNNMTEFYIDVGMEKQKPKKQNWHDNPLAVLPMTVGPFFL